MTNILEKKCKLHRKTETQKPLKKGGDTEKPYE